MPAFVDIHEYSLPRKLFIELGGFSSGDLSHFCAANDIQPNEDGLPIFATMKALNQVRKRKGAGSDDEVSIELKTEKLQEVRIKNQERLGQLIPKDMAKERVRETFQAVANSIRYAVKLAAPQVAICNNARDCENILISAYNNALEDLHRKAKDISWEDDGVKTQLGRTELVEDSQTDSSGGSDSEDSSPIEGEYSGENRPDADSVS